MMEIKTLISPLSSMIKISTVDLKTIIYISSFSCLPSSEKQEKNCRVYASHHNINISSITTTSNLIEFLKNQPCERLIVYTIGCLGETSSQMISVINYLNKIRLNTYFVTME